MKTLEHKLENKLALQEELGWPQEKKVPMVCIPMEMNDNNGGALLQELIPGLLSLNTQILVIGKGESTYGELWSSLASEHSHRIAILADDDDSKRKMFAAADMALFVTDASDAEELEHCLRYGAVPVAPKSKGLKNYNPIQESGNAFVYDKPEVWHCFAAVVRAVETQGFPFDWRTIQKNCMDALQPQRA